jgi:hypothetical protein
MFGLETVYAYLLKFGVSIFTSFSSNVHPEITSKSGKIFFQLLYDNTGWEEPLETICLPFVILFTWQFFLFFHIEKKKAWKIALRNLGIFYCTQVLYMLLLYGMNDSAFVRFLFYLIKNSFGIIVIFFIIWDIANFNISFKNKPLYFKSEK